MLEALADYIVNAERQRFKCKDSRGQGTAAIKRLHSMLEQSEAALRDLRSDTIVTAGLQLPPAARLSSSQAAAPLPGDAAAKRHRDTVGTGFMGVRHRNSNESEYVISSNFPPKPAGTRSAIAPQHQHSSVYHQVLAPIIREQAVNASIPGSSGSQESDEEMWDAQEFEDGSPEQPQHQQASVPTAPAAAEVPSRSPTFPANGKNSRRVACNQPASPHASLKPPGSSRRSPVAPSTPPAPKTHSAGPSADDPIVLSSGDDTEAPEEAPRRRSPLRTRPSPQRPLVPPQHRPTMIRPLHHLGSGAPPATSSASHHPPSRAHSHMAGRVQDAPRQGSSKNHHVHASMWSCNVAAGLESFPKIAPTSPPGAAVFRGGTEKSAAQHAVRARRSAATSKSHRGRAGSAQFPASGASFRINLDGDHPPHLPPKPQPKAAATFGIRTNAPPAPVKQQQRQAGPAHAQHSGPGQSAQDASAAAGMPVGNSASPNDGHDGLFASRSELPRKNEGLPNFACEVKAGGTVPTAGRLGVRAPSASHTSKSRGKGRGPLSRPVAHWERPVHGTAECPLELSSDDEYDRPLGNLGFSPMRNSSSFPPKAFATGQSAPSGSGIFKGFAAQQQRQQQQRHPADGDNSSTGRAPFTAAAQSTSTGAAAQQGGVFTGSGPFSRDGGTAQRARRPNNHRRAAQPVLPSARQRPFTLPSNPPLATAPLRPQPQRQPQPKSSTWGPPSPTTTNPPAAAPVAQKPRPPLSPHQQFIGAADGNASSPAQRRPHRKEGTHSRQASKQFPFVPGQQPHNAAATGWVPHVWEHTSNGGGKSAARPPATSPPRSAASGDSKSAGVTAPVSSSSKPPVFSAGASSAAPAARPIRASGRAHVRKPQSSRSAPKAGGVAPVKAAFPAVPSAAVTEVDAASEATRAAFVAHSLNDGAGISGDGGEGATSRAADSTHHGNCAAPEVMRQQHRSTAAAIAAEALEWEQRQAEIRKQGEEVKRLKLQRKAAAAAATRVEERQLDRLQAHRQLEIKKAAEAAQRENLRGATAASLQARLRGHITLVSILRELKIPIDGDPYPSVAQIEKAKKKAQVKFHPDRNQDKPVNVLIEAEELFKIINDAPISAPRASYAPTRGPSYPSYRHW